MNEYDFTIDQGATWTWSLEEFSEDISSYDFKMQIRKEKNRDSDLLFDVTPFMSIDSNNLVVNVSVEETESVVFSKGFYDLFMTDDSGQTSKILSGCVSVSNQITYEDS